MQWYEEAMKEIKDEKERNFMLEKLKKRIDFDNLNEEQLKKAIEILNKIMEDKPNV